MKFNFREKMGIITDIIKGISCLEAALKEMGDKIDLGQGVSAAKKSLFK